jgi:hypothetical protein
VSTLVSLSSRVPQTVGQARTRYGDGSICLHYIQGYKIGLKCGAHTSDVGFPFCIYIALPDWLPHKTAGGNATMSHMRAASSSRPGRLLELGGQYTTCKLVDFVV